MTTQPNAKQGAEQPKVVPLREKDRPFLVRHGKSLRRLTRNWGVVSILLVVALPLIVTALYLFAIASDRYAVEVRFAVRSQETTALDALGVLGGMAGGSSSTGGDSYILVDYLRSRQLIDDLKDTIDLKSAYSKDDIDLLSRFSSHGTNAELTEYWRKMTRAYFDSSTGIVNVETSAFTAAESLKIAEGMTKQAALLVNRLSSEARTDALKAAEDEVARAEQRQRFLRAATRKFREQEQIADPVRRAGFQQEMVEKFKAELNRIDTELASIRPFMKDDAPSVTVLKSQRSAITQQIATLERQIGGEPNPAGAVAGANQQRTTASMLSSFEELEAERVFAEKSYMTALASLEHARLEADRKHRYLAVYVAPKLPDEAIYPAKLHTLSVVAATAILAWLIGWLLFLGVREHI